MRVHFLSSSKRTGFDSLFEEAGGLFACLDFFLKHFQLFPILGTPCFGFY